MNWFDRTIGRRLVLRLYVYLAVLFMVIAGTAMGGARLAIEPERQAVRREGLAWLADDMLVQRASPDVLRERIAALHDRVGVNLTLFSADGRIMAGSAVPSAGPLDAQTLERLAKDGFVTLSPDVFAVAHTEHDRLAAYAIVEFRALHPSAWRGVVVLAIVLGLLGLGSLALARGLARPLERLAKVTQTFGLGQLRARASTDRQDEIGDLGRAFNQMADRIEQLRRAEKELLANVSHELRTPLARIRVVVELAEGGEPQQTQRYLSAIAEDLTEVEQLLGDIIAAARLDLGNERVSDPYPPLRLVPAPLASELKELVRRFREAHPDRDVRSTIEASVTVPIDRVMFKHAVSNVLDNAHKYSSRGCPIEVALRLDDAEGGKAVVEVRDQGRGIDPADVPHVFTAFFRADRSRSRDTGGVGLGLTLARRIIEAHAGTIELKSRPGEGTTVTIKLPGGTPTADPS